MATIKQFTVIVRDVTDKDNTFISEQHIVRAKSKAEAADVVWERLEKELFEKDGIVSRDKQIVKQYYKITVELTRLLGANGYQTADVRAAKKAEARRKAAAKKAAAKATNQSGPVRTKKLSA